MDELNLSVEALQAGRINDIVKSFIAFSHCGRQGEPGSERQGQTHFYKFSYPAMIHFSSPVY
ncbi:MAG: hypothetical protein ACU833_07800 [Gammaproteobacteria bacterium]